MRNWKCRELALLAVFLLLVIWHAYDAARVRLGRMKRFEITPAELEGWAREIDASVRLVPAKVDMMASPPPTTAYGHWELEIPASREYEIVKQWELQFRAKINQNGWRFIHSSSGGDTGSHHFQISFRNRESYYETFLHANHEAYPFAKAAPSTTSDPKSGHGRVRLSVDWFAVGYTPLRREWHRSDDTSLEADGDKQSAVDKRGSRQ